jgi:hypothetical protein
MIPRQECAVYAKWRRQKNNSGTFMNGKLSIKKLNGEVEYLE